LHLILRDFIKTVPLISKIHLKDSDGMTVHGFDAVHIGNCIEDSSKKSLYLGESKLYKDGKSVELESYKPPFDKRFADKEWDTNPFFTYHSGFLA
jgi:hypothetical protein